MRHLAAVLLLLPLSVAAGRSSAPSSQTTSLLMARTSPEGRVLEFDFPSLHIGTAEYDEGPTGVTVFYFPAGR